MKFELISENLQPLAVIYYTIGGGPGGPGTRSPYKPPKPPAGAAGGSSGPPPVLTAIHIGEGPGGPTVRVALQAPRRGLRRHIWPPPPMWISGFRKVSRPFWGSLRGAPDSNFGEV